MDIDWFQLVPGFFAGAMCTAIFAALTPKVSSCIRKQMLRLKGVKTNARIVDCYKESKHRHSDPLYCFETQYIAFDSNTVANMNQSNINNICSIVLRPKVFVPYELYKQVNQGSLRTIPIRYLQSDIHTSDAEINIVSKYTFSREVFIGILIWCVVTFWLVWAQLYIGLILATMMEFIFPIKRMIKYFGERKEFDETNLEQININNCMRDNELISIPEPLIHIIVMFTKQKCHEYENDCIKNKFDIEKVISYVNKIDLSEIEIFIDPIAIKQKQEEMQDIQFDEPSESTSTDHTQEQEIVQSPES